MSAKTKKMFISVGFRYAELQKETPVERIRIMNKEFGPYWYYFMTYGQDIPKDKKANKRYAHWLTWRNHNKEK